MLHNHTSRLRKTFHAFPGGIRIGDVVVRQFLTLQLPVITQRAKRGLDVAIKRRMLMGIFAIAQILNFIELQIQPRGKFLSRCCVIQRR